MDRDEYHISDLADAIDALEAELSTVASRDPLDPQIGLLSHQLSTAIRHMYEMVPRGV